MHATPKTFMPGVLSGWPSIGVGPKRLLSSVPYNSTPADKASPLLVPFLLSCKHEIPLASLQSSSTIFDCLRSVQQASPSGSPAMVSQQSGGLMLSIKGGK